MLTDTERANEIDRLEKILNSEDARPVRITPDGKVAEIEAPASDTERARAIVKNWLSAADLSKPGWPEPLVPAILSAFEEVRGECARIADDWANDGDWDPDCCNGIASAIRSNKGG